jgi:hypothetical protein
MTVLTAVDCEHKYVPNIPDDDKSIQQVNGYVTGSADIRWTDDDFARFPDTTVKLTIAQMPDNNPLADILDVEPGAATDPGAVTWVKTKHAKKEVAVLYADASDVPALYKAIAGAGELAQTYLWLADWNLDENEAAALLGTEYGGFKVTGVQWASPASNPHTLLPGTNYALADCGCDLSVFSPVPRWTEPAARLVSVVAVATFSDGSKKSWSIS